MQIFQSYNTPWSQRADFLQYYHLRTDIEMQKLQLLQAWLPFHFVLPFYFISWLDTISLLCTNHYTQRNHVRNEFAYSRALMSCKLKKKTLMKRFIICYVCLLTPKRNVRHVLTPCFITFINVIIHILLKSNHSLAPRFLCMGGKNREPGTHYA